MRRLGSLSGPVFLSLLVIGSGGLAVAEEGLRTAHAFPSLYPEGRFEFEDGMSLAYVDHGEGYPVVFLHGLGADHHQWNLNMPALEGRFRVLALDFPGHGKSDRVADYDYGIPRFTRALIEFLDDRGVERAVLIGNSMGGQIALNTALHHPDRVERLILVDTAGAGDLGDWRRTLCRFGLDNDLSRVVNPVTTRLLDGFVVRRNQGSEITKEMRTKMSWDAADDKRRHELNQTLTTCLESIFAHDLSRRLGEIEQKTLVVWGSSDLLVPVRHAFRLRVRMPDARLIVYPGVGHVPSLEVPDRFNKAMVRFLEPLRGTVVAARK